MSLFPKNTNVVQRAQTDAKSVYNTLHSVVCYTPGSPVATDDDWFVAAATAMKVGTYTLLHTAPDTGARNIVITHTAVDAADTLGTITVAGTNLAGVAITEAITPSSGTTAAGAKAFATVTSITGSGWITNGGADTIKIGFADKIGFPDKLTRNTVLATYLNNAKEGTAPTVAMSASALESNTFDLNSAMDGNAVHIYYIP